MQGLSGAGGGGALGGSIGAVTSGIQAFGTISKALAPYRADEYNAGIAQQNVALTNETGASQEAASDASYRGAEGRQLAAIGGSGLMMGTGSTLQAVAQSRVMQTMSAMQISRSAQIKAMGYQEQADVDKAKARGDLISGIIGGASGLLNTATDYANQSNASGYGSSPVGALQMTATPGYGVGSSQADISSANFGQ